MFYDERIEAVRGKVCRNAIAIAAPVAALALLFRLLTLHGWQEIDTGRYLYLLSVEAATFLGTLSVLIIGFFRAAGQQHDEMWQARQGTFYRKACGTLVRIVLGVWAIFLPCALAIGAPRDRMAVAYAALFPVLLFVLGAYAVCTFRRQDIYFNYAALESDHYARAVGRNLGRAGLWALGYFVLSFFCTLALLALSKISVQALPRAYLRLLLGYLGACLVVSALYLMLSYLEWASFHRKQVISPSTKLCLIATVAVYVVYTLLVVVIDRLPLTQATSVALVSYAAKLHDPVRMLLLLFLSYFAYEYRKMDIDRLTPRICNGMITLCAVRVGCDLLYSCLTSLFWAQLTDPEAFGVRRVLVTFNTTLHTGELLLLSLGFALIIFGLVKHQRIHRAHVAAIPALLLIWGVGIFLSTQVDTVQLELYRCLASAALLIYACSVFLSIRWGEQDLST